ncbi:hypothetical protein ACJ6WF_40685 [Streptomyces sp. MMS24-I2-30]|uniref:hypothetical protein n=1 Tax=Streptomyces sp. MMS24-I2-30 TaxID=3351564 RepID=UPI003896EBBD
MDQHAGAGDRDQAAAGIRVLYFPQDGSLPLVATGVLPTQRRKGAPEWEVRARRRMHHLLKPDRRASPAEVEVLRDAGIPLLQREGGGFRIDPGVARVSDEAAAVAGFDSAVAIAELYGLTEGSSALVPRGALPTFQRKGAPAGEAKARKRMHNLLRPGRRASPAEVEVLREAGIPLLQREGGGFRIDPGVARVSDEAAAMARVDSAVAIAGLYGLTEGSSALVPRGVLPTLRRKGAPEWEVKARKRMHNLLRPGHRTSPAEERVLGDAGIPLLPQEDGSFRIAPGVARESDEAAATAGFDNASAIAALYGLTVGSSALLPRGVLPTQSRKDAPEPEVKARQRMHNLLKPESRVSAAEEKVLREAGIPLLQRKDGSYHIDPGVARESGVKRAGSSAVPALPSGQRPPVAASASSLPVAAVPAWPEQLAAGATGAVGAAGDPFPAGGREGSHSSGPGLWQVGSGLPPGTGMPWTQDSIPIPLGQGGGVHPAQPVQAGFPEVQPGFAEGRPGFAEVLSGGSGGGLGPVVYGDVGGWVPGGFGGGSVDTVSGVSGVSGFWSAPVNPAAPYTGGYPPGVAWDVQPPGTDALTQATQELASQELAARELGAWEPAVAAPAYPRTDHVAARSPWDPATAYGRLGHAPAATDGDTDTPVPGRPAMSAAGAYLPQGLPVTLGTRAREDSEQPAQGTPADRPKRARRG